MQIDRHDRDSISIRVSMDSRNMCTPTAPCDTLLMNARAHWLCIGPGSGLGPVLGRLQLVSSHWSVLRIPIDTKWKEAHSPIHTTIHIDGGLEAENSKDDHTGVDGRNGVADGHQEHVPHTVVLGGVVAAEGNQGAKGQAEGVEHLGGCVQPDGRLQQLLHLGRVHVHQAGTRSPECYAPYEEDGQHNVGEQGGEVDHLAGALDALHHDEEDNGPGEEQAEDNPPLQAAGLVHRGCRIQGGSIPEVLCLRWLGAFLQLESRSIGGTSRPGQRILQG